MDRSLLKNIIIIILVLVNAFLLASLLLRQNSALHSQRQTEEQLIELFAADGMTLEKKALSQKTPPPSFVLNRSIAREREAAAYFLGSNLIQEDQGGGTYTYTGDSGVARFRSNGSFEVAGTLATEDVESFCRSFCKSFSYDTPYLTWMKTETAPQPLSASLRIFLFSTAPSRSPCIMETC